MSSHGLTPVGGISVQLPVQQPGIFSSITSSALDMFTGFFDWFGNLGLFSWQVLKAAATPPYEWREFFRQLDEVGSKSMPLVALAGAAIGVVNVAFVVYLGIVLAATRRKRAHAARAAASGAAIETPAGGR